MYVQPTTAANVLLQKQPQC